MSSNFLLVNLPSKIKITTPYGKELETDKIEVYKVVDEMLSKTITAFCRNHPTQIVLWKDAEYDSIGQWTNDDVTSKILDLYSNK